MCRMCDWLGDGETWYMHPKNYANRLYKLREPGTKAATSMGGGGAGEGESSPRRRRTVGAAIDAKANGDMGTFREIVDEINERASTRPGAQVVPLQECIDIIEKVGMPVGAMMCICRKNTRAEEETDLNQYSCMGLGTGMFKWERWPERYRGGVEFLSPKQAAEWLKYWDDRGMVHMLMQEGGDFIGGLCNCDYPDCVPIRHRIDYGLNFALTKGEYVCEVDYDKCNGCGQCLGRCQFNALKYESTIDKPNIDPMECYGCGLCETACTLDAITFVDRKSSPVLRNVW